MHHKMQEVKLHSYKHDEQSLSLYYHLRQRLGIAQQLIIQRRMDDNYMQGQTGDEIF